MATRTLAMVVAMAKLKFSLHGVSCDLSLENNHELISLILRVSCCMNVGHHFLYKLYLLKFFFGTCTYSHFLYIFL